MQRICDGARSKQDVLAFLIDQYKGVYIKAKREFNTVIEVRSTLLELARSLTAAVCGEIPDW